MAFCLRAIAFSIVALTFRCWAQDFHPDVPKAWEDNAIEGLEVRLAQRDRSPRCMSAEEYYKLKVRPIYRSYPVYAKGREPAGYIESLKQKDPEIIFDPFRLHTKEDWIAAGKLAFESDTRFFPSTEPPRVDDIPAPPSTVSKDGMLPGFTIRYYIRKKGPARDRFKLLLRLSYACNGRRLLLGGRAGRSLSATISSTQSKTGECRPGTSHAE